MGREGAFFRPMSFTRQRNRRRTDAVSRRGMGRFVPPSFGSWAGTGALCMLALGAVLLLGRSIWVWAARSGVFALRGMVLTGNQRVTESELMRLAGLSWGQNLLTLDMAAVERAMAQHPWVRHIELARRLPRAISVRVQEHQPAAMVALGELYVVDEEGEPFKKLQAEDGMNLPLITGLPREAFVSGKEDARSRLKTAMEMALAYESSAVSHGAPLSEVRVGSGGVTLVTGQGQEVRMGEAGAKEKMARLAKVRGELARRGVRAQVIHLDNRSRPGWVAVKLAMAGPQSTDGSQK
jgi:cell division protein FtsQ